MLRISLRDGEALIVNGALLRASGRTELVVENQVSLLRGREIMAEEEADTPAKQLYFACMMAYINEDSEAQRDAIADSDIVITTAQLFGRKPPVLISKQTLALMKPGSVVVDMAALSGGNVEGSVPGETAVVEGVTVIGDGNWSQRVARDATDMYANNLINLIDEFFDKESEQFTLDLEDEILASSVITHAGEITNDMLKNAYKGG